MTGKTHMAISTAIVAVALSATGTRVSGSGGAQCLLCSPGFPCFLPSCSSVPGLPDSGIYAIAGLLVLGMVAGLFPDLDAPDTELQHLPRRMADRLGWYTAAGLRRRRGMQGYSPLARLVQGSIHLIALPFTLLVSAIGAGLRASPLGSRHRGFTHTLLGTLVFTGLATGAALSITGSVHWALSVGAVWLIGYASHLAADACTPSGIPLFMSQVALKHLGRASTATTSTTSTTFHLLPKRMRVRTGTIADTLMLRWIAWTVCAAAVISMFIA